MNQGYTMKGLQFKIGKRKFRIWSGGFEIGNQLGGKVYFFPWTKTYWRMRKIRREAK